LAYLDFNNLYSDAEKLQSLSEWEAGLLDKYEVGEFIPLIVKHKDKEYVFHQYTERSSVKTR
jgi:hypothetical protein